MKNNILTPLILSFFSFLLFSCADSDYVVSPTGSGTGGSMARFAVAGDFLYIVDSHKLDVYDIKDPSSPEKLKEVKLGIGIETIFPYQHMLFIGAQDGMHIYDIADPQNPTHLSTYTHVTSCDPVVVQGELAYVTLRNGNTCTRGMNQLDILNISNPSQPKLINSYPMTNPFGLGIDGNTLFVCEGEHGMKVLNVEDPRNIQEMRSFTNLHAYDVIPSRNNLILTGKTGIIQYNYEDPDNIAINSKLEIANCE